MMPALIERLDWRRIATALGVVVFLGILAVVVTAAVPQTVGADHSYVVMSDSMSPTIDAGSIVYVDEESPDDIEVGDVITYTDQNRRVTHRVVEVVSQDGSRQFRTKGDANEDPDPELVRSGDVVGVVQFHLPLVGYGINAAQSPAGIVALVVVPALLLLVSELWDLYSRARTDTAESDPEEE